MGRIPWKESNLALIGSELDHKIKAAAADGEEQWVDLGSEEGTRVWRIEQFKVVPWPPESYGSFHKGDSYVVLNSYKKDDGTDTLYHDLYIWIGSESSQDEYGTAAYKMVEADDKLGGAAVQHRVVEGKEPDRFRSYFGGGDLTYLTGGAESGFHHVEATPDAPHLYKVKGTDRGMSLSQVELKKSSLNAGDSFILFANDSSVWLWNGQGANPDEKARANSLAERMCSRGTVTVLDQGAGDEDDSTFWGYLGEGDIQEADEEDEGIEEFCPLLFKLAEDPDDEPEQVAKGEEITYGSPVAKISRDHLNESDVLLLDAGWEIFLWMGSGADSGAKVASMGKAEAYCRDDPRTADLPLTLVKSGFEPYEFSALFV